MWLYGVFSLLFDLITHSVNPDGTGKSTTPFNLTTTSAPDNGLGFHIGDLKLSLEVEHHNETTIEAEVQDAIKHLEKMETASPKTHPTTKTHEVTTPSTTASTTASTTSESTTQSTTESTTASTSQYTTQSTTKSTTQSTIELTTAKTESITAGDGGAKDLKKELENVKTLSEVENSLLDKFERMRKSNKDDKDEEIEIDVDGAKTVFKRENQDTPKDDETMANEQKDNEDDEIPTEVSWIANGQVYNLINEANGQYLTADDGVVKVVEEDDEGQKWKMVRSEDFWELESLDGIGKSKGARWGQWIIKPVESKPGLYNLQTFEDQTECLSMSGFDNDSVAIIECHKATPWRVVKG